MGSLRRYVVNSCEQVKKCKKQLTKLVVSTYEIKGEKLPGNMDSSDEYVEIVANSDDEFSDDSDDYAFEKRLPRDSRCHADLH